MARRRLATVVLLVAAAAGLGLQSGCFVPARSARMAAAPAAAPAPRDLGWERVRFTSASAQWLYSPPLGAHTDLSGDARVRAITLGLNTRAGGYDYPVQFTTGGWGATRFDDYGFYGRRDRISVPNVQPDGCGWRPSTGSDGHLIVLDTARRRYYDFWRLCVDAQGCAITCPGNRGPTSIGEIRSGRLVRSNGTPGTTAAQMTGLAGVIAPGELSGDDRLDHALAIVVAASLMNPRLCHAVPATHTDGTVPGALFCEGAKIRMDPAVNLAQLPASPAAKAIMHALQMYGGAIVDQSGCQNCIQAYTALPGRPPDLTGIEAATQHLWIYPPR